MPITTAKRAICILEAFAGTGTPTVAEDLLEKIAWSK